MSSPLGRIGAWPATAALALLAASATGAGAAQQQMLASFDGGTAWLNSQPLTPAGLAGKVVLVDFWEYTCINCLKALPYERTWYQRYAKDGFVIVGVHTPEFAFSGETANVANAVKRLQIDWPVVVDAQQKIWNRYGNDAWPHEFLYDQRGVLVAEHEGEGDYPETEARIQQLLRASDPNAKFPAPMDYLPQDRYSKPGAVCYRHTPEMYVGDWRGDGALGNEQGYAKGKTIAYVDSGPHDDGRAYLLGPWYQDGEAMVSASGPPVDEHVAIRYRAIQVVAVLAPSGQPVPAFVLQDGAALTRASAGPDVRFDEHGRAFVLVNAPREYDLVTNKQFGQHDLELRPERPGLRVYTFDFEACEVGADR
ncbi:MAG: redoxin family protein [Candidatus Eremiobacteraeota bacterium]|nr:redoxin family protein [Candidatus Eremiobacteraeota bacterium]